MFQHHDTLVAAPRRTRIAALAPLLALFFAASAAAETIATQLRGSYVESIQSGGVTVPRADFRCGISNGSVLAHPWGTTIRAADGRNLESYFIRNGSPVEWDIDLGSRWTPGSGPAADFFVFDVGGNDTVRVRPRFLNGSLGGVSTITGWSATSVIVDGGPNAGQRVHGVGFRIEDLRHSNGAPLTAQDRIRGIRIESGSIDGASFLVRDPGANAGTNGNGTSFFTPATPRVGSPMELTFHGPWCSETDESPNPFLHYRLTVTFTGPGNQVFRVPGFFDADGESGDAGNHWTVRFLPPAAGSWTATASMRSGTNAAINLDPNSGGSVPSVDGRTVTFQVAGVDPTERGFFRLGTLRDSGKHHRKFEHGPYYLKAGTNGPENFLALRAVDDTTKSGGEGNLHSFGPHRSDWRAGDPILDEGNPTDDGKGVIGALNYLESVGVNSLFLLVMNLGGDGNDVYPFLGPRNRTFEKLHYDTSRLRQWNLIFEHAQRCGISLSLVMNETEIQNELWLDGGNLGAQRKLFYREMVARFGHLPAIRWNISEETDFTAQQLSNFAAYLSAQDADDHAVAFHNHPNELQLFQQLASDPNIDAASLQHGPDVVDAQVEAVRAFSSQAGRPWIVDADEMGPWQIGLTDMNARDIRKRIMYDALFSGGGIEFYFGWHDLPLGGDLSLEDFRTRSEMWGYLGHARRFMEDNLPFWDMEPMDELVRWESSAFGGAEVYAIPGEYYAIYYPSAAGTGQLDLRSVSGSMELLWFNPRTGAMNTPRLLSGGNWRDMGAPPSQSSEDWVALVRRSAPLTASITSGSLSQGDTQVLTFRPGTPFARRSFLLVSSLSGTQMPFELGGLTVPVTFDRWSRYALGDSQGNVFENRIGVLNGAGSTTIRVHLDPAFIGGLAGVTMYHCVVLRNPYDYASNVVTLTVTP